jgi:hypothetical protein
MQALADDKQFKTPWRFIHTGMMSPGAGIGEHIHGNCEEIFFCLDPDAHAEFVVRAPLSCWQQLDAVQLTSRAVHCLSTMAARPRSKGRLAFRAALATRMESSTTLTSRFAGTHRSSQYYCWDLPHSQFCSQLAVPDETQN